MVMVVPYVGTWIEIGAYWYICPGRHSRSLRGNVDRNIASASSISRFPSRSLRGNVDRNMLYLLDRLIVVVVPYVGTWIEIRV